MMNSDVQHGITCSVMGSDCICHEIILADMPHQQAKMNFISYLLAFVVLCVLPLKS
jgi:hypothetical protein